jgi:hypothetical protein
MIQDVPLEVGHVYVPTDNSNVSETISQRIVTLLYIRIESNRLHIQFPVQSSVITSDTIDHPSYWSFIFLENPRGFLENNGFFLNFNSGRLFEEGHFVTLHTIEEGCKNLENMECIKVWIQILEKSQVKRLLKYTLEVLIHTNEDFWGIRENLSDMALDFLCQVGDGIAINIVRGMVNDIGRFYEEASKKSTFQKTPIGKVSVG